MTSLIFCLAVLAADPTPAEAKLIEKTKAELDAARIKTAKPLLAKIEAAKADLEAVEEGEVSPQLKQQFTRKVVKGKPVYVFRHESYREKERQRLNELATGTNRTNDETITPPLNMLALRVGAKGRLAFTINDLYTASITENEPGPEYIDLLVTVAGFDSRSKPVQVRLRVRGTTAISDNGKVSCLVTGIQKVHGQPTYQLLVVEQFDNAGNLIAN